MSDPTPEPPEPTAEPLPPPAEAPPQPRHWLPWIGAVGWVILAVALVWVWQHPVNVPVSTEQTDALARQVGALETRVSRLEQRPQPQIPDLGPLSARLAALEQRPPPQAAPQVDLGPLERRVSALEQRQPPDLAPLQARIAAVENASRAAESNLSQRMAADESRMAAMEAIARRIPLVQSAALALAAGEKLGNLPGAPPALARYADAPPPTEAALREAFPKAARQALATSHPDNQGQPFLARLWTQAQDLVTVRQGEHVLVGDPAAGVLERARAALNAGDLAAAVAAVATLEGTPREAMADWQAQARALLDARAALVSWAASG